MISKKRLAAHKLMKFTICEGEKKMMMMTSMTMMIAAHERFENTHNDTTPSKIEDHQQQKNIKDRRPSMIEDLQ